MKSFETFNKTINTLFCDIDDTLTSEGQLHAGPYEMLWKLSEAGVAIVPITGRPAGWCEMIARLWPVKGIIGENGAFYFSYQNQTMKRVFACDPSTQAENREKLLQIQGEVLRTIPGSALASDQFCRMFDLAIDFCEDVPPLDESAIQKIVGVFHRHGATAKVSSIHVNGWFGDHDKKTMCQTYFRNEFQKELIDNLESCAFVGDSPNDEPMFGYFENAFAVANIQKFLDQLTHKPKYLMTKSGGEGFVQLAHQILKYR